MNTKNSEDKVNVNIQESSQDSPKARKNRLTTYLTVFFFVVIFIMVLSYFVSQRNNMATISDLAASSQSATQNIVEQVQDLTEENMQLEEEIETLAKKEEALEEQLSEASEQTAQIEAELADVQAQLAVSKSKEAASEQFSKLVARYLAGDAESCRKIISEMETTGMMQHLSETAAAAVTAISKNISQK